METEIGTSGIAFIRGVAIFYSLEGADIAL